MAVKSKYYKRSKRECEQCHVVKSIEGTRKFCWSCRDLNTKVEAGTVRAPDYPDVNTSNYKEPMQKVKGGFGYLGAITTTNDGKLIQCHICGYYFESLGAHVSNKHKMKPREYKMKHGLRINDGLLSPVMKIKAQVTYNKYGRKSVEEFTEMSRKAIKNRKNMGGNVMTAQTRNEKGLCRDQTIAKIRNLAERNNGVVTLHAFEREYGKGQRDVVEYWFGTWLKGVEAAGLDSWFKHQQMKRKQRNKHILRLTKEFYKRNGRTPLANALRKAAKVPQLVHFEGQWQEMKDLDIVMPVPGRLSRGFGFGNRTHR